MTLMEGKDSVDINLLTVGETAERLRIGRSKVYELIRTGQLASVKIGGSRRIAPSALAAFIAQLTGRAA